MIKKTPAPLVKKNHHPLPGDLSRSFKNACRLFYFDTSSTSLYPHIQRLWIGFVLLELALYTIVMLCGLQAGDGLFCYRAFLYTLLPSRECPNTFPNYHSIRIFFYSSCFNKKKNAPRKSVLPPFTTHAPPPPCCQLFPCQIDAAACTRVQARSNAGPKK